MNPTSPLQVLWAILPLVGVAFGLGLGIWWGRRQRRPPTDEQVARYMGKVVNQEELEEHQRLLKFKMARNGLKSMRTDGGPNAKMLRLRVRPTSRRFRNGNK